jgi:hypothetical protein
MLYAEAVSKRVLLQRLPLTKRYCPSIMRIITLRLTRVAPGPGQNIGILIYRSRNPTGISNRRECTLNYSKYLKTYKYCTLRKRFLVTSNTQVCMLVTRRDCANVAYTKP